MVKVVKSESKEVEITQELISGARKASSWTPLLPNMEIKEIPSNPHLSCIEMPPGGSYITTYPHLKEELFRLIQEFLKGVAFLHKNQVAHLDLKPENVLVSMEGEVRIIDYGTSVLARETKSLRVKGLIGTNGFMAPEILREEEFLVFPADIYSAGCVIREMFLGPGTGRGKRLRVEKLVKKLKSELPEDRPTAEEAVKKARGLSDERIVKGFRGFANIMHNISRVEAR